MTSLLGTGGIIKPGTQPTKGGFRKSAEAAAPEEEPIEVAAAASARETAVAASA